MPGKVDLHLHTNHSDGFYSPAELVKKAKESGLDTVSITDHDNQNGIAEAREAGSRYGVDIIPGVEISSDIRNKELHLLGYFIEPDNLEFTRYLAFFREERIKRADRIVKKLCSLGLTITLKEVMEKANNSAVGRPHIAQVLHEKGLVSSFYDAFNKYLGNDCPAYEKKVHISPQSACKIISDAGGLSFIAHPGNMPENLLLEVIEAGVDGIEVFHPSHSPQHIRFYKGIVNEYFLLESGGSDFHGGKREDEANLGRYYAPPASVEAMKTRLHKKKK